MRGRFSRPIALVMVMAVAGAVLAYGASGTVTGAPRASATSAAYTVAQVAKLTRAEKLKKALKACKKEKKKKRKACEAKAKKLYGKKPAPRTSKPGTTTGTATTTGTPATTGTVTTGTATTGAATTGAATTGAATTGAATTGAATTGAATTGAATTGPGTTGTATTGTTTTTGGTTATGTSGTTTGGTTHETQAEEEAKLATLTESPSVGEVAKGKPLFEGTCASCHGIAGEGVAGAGPKLSETERGKTVKGVIEQLIEPGPGAMPKYQTKYTFEEKRQLGEYVVVDITKTEQANH